MHTYIMHVRFMVRFRAEAIKLRFRLDCLCPYTNVFVGT